MFLIVLVKLSRKTCLYRRGQLQETNASLDDRNISYSVSYHMKSFNLAPSIPHVPEDASYIGHVIGVVIGRGGTSPYVQQQASMENMLLNGKLCLDQLWKSRAYFGLGSFGCF